jgi:hypothetical protein
MTYYKYLKYKKKINTFTKEEIDTLINGNIQIEIDKQIERERQKMHNRQELVRIINLFYDDINAIQIYCEDQLDCISILDNIYIIMYFNVQNLLLFYIDAQFNETRRTTKHKIINILKYLYKIKRKVQRISQNQHKSVNKKNKILKTILDQINFKFPYNYNLY